MKNEIEAMITDITTTTTEAEGKMQNIYDALKRPGTHHPTGSQ